MAYAANPFKHELQGEIYLKAWRDLKARLKGFRTVPIVNGTVKAAKAPATVYALKIRKALTHDALTSLEDAKQLAQSVADTYGIPVGIVDKQNKALVGTVASRRRSPNAFWANPTSKKRRRRAAPCWYCVRDQRGRVLAKSTSKPTILAWAQNEANKLGKALGVGKL